MNPLYLDNNATTPVLPPVWEAMRPYFTDVPGNPASSHRAGRRARQALEDARDQTAALLGAAPDEVVFTSGATEANNLAVFGLAGSPPGHLLVSPVEHPCVLEPARRLAEAGFRLDGLTVSSAGVVEQDALPGLLGPETRLVSVMLANHETGAVQPVPQLANLAAEHGAPFHCDAAAAAGKVPVRFGALGVTALTISAHKFHGPKGVGGLFARRGLRLRPLVIGGPQEHGRRGGTENVPGIVGMGKAAELAKAALPQMPRVAAMRDRLERTILESIPHTRVNGRTDLRLPNTSSIGFARLEAEAILLLLSEQGVCASAGAACSSGSLEPSHVLKAMHIDPLYAHGSIRFSLSRYTADAEIDRALTVLPTAIEKLRAVLPVGV